MPRRKAIVPNREIHTTLPEDLASQIDKLIWSPGLNCIPRGALQDLLITLLRKFLESRSLDLHPFIASAMPNQYVVEGDAPSIMTLSTLLKEV